MAVCHHAIFPSETSKETEIKTTAQALAVESRKQSCSSSCVSCQCISVGFRSASLSDVLDLALMISIVSLSYFLSTVSRAEWSCGRGWSATVSSGTWKMFIPNLGMDMQFPPLFSRPAGCPIPPAPQSFPLHLPSPYLPMPQRCRHPFAWASGEGHIKFCAAFKHSLLALWHGSFVNLLSLSSLTDSIALCWWGAKHHLFLLAIGASSGILLPILWNRWYREIASFPHKSIPR